MNNIGINVFISPIDEIYIPEILDIQNESNLSPWTKEDYLSEVNRDDSNALMAIHEIELAGFIVMRQAAHSEAEIYNLAVRKKYRGRGIGKKLLTYAIRKAVSRTEIRHIWLEVRESNLPAIRFYESVNFAVCGMRKNFYSNPTENALLMKLEIDEFLIRNFLKLD